MQIITRECVSDLRERVNSKVQIRNVSIISLKYMQRSQKEY